MISGVLTTGQAAKICKVAPRTVTRWFDSGRLHGYKIPGSQDRRIPRENLYRFMEKHGIPLYWMEETGVQKTLVVSTDLELWENLHSLTTDSFCMARAVDVFDAGIQTKALRPHCVVIDFAFGRNAAIFLSRMLHAHIACRDIVLIGLMNDEDGHREFDRSLFADMFRKPFDPALLAQRIKTLVRQQQKRARRA